MIPIKPQLTLFYYKANTNAIIIISERHKAAIYHRIGAGYIFLYIAYYDTMVRLGKHLLEYGHTTMSP